MKKYFLIVFFAVPIICFSQKDKKQKTYTEFGTCWDSRETVHTIESCNGMIIKISDQLWAVQPDNSNSRYGLCEIPEKLKSDKLKIIFSGEVKKIAPNERMAATPCKMKSITIIE